MFFLLHILILKIISGRSFGETSCVVHIMKGFLFKLIVLLPSGGKGVDRKGNIPVLN
jgi:hypothetical protein